MGAAARGLSGAPRIQVALQLYSLRRECERDLPGTLAAVASAGYEAVEFAGYHGRGAAELRSLLEKSHLRCCGAHIPIDDLLGERLSATIRFHQTLGNRNLVVPGLPESYTASRRAWVKTARLFSNLSLQLEPAGMRLGYHNHSAEFHTLEGERPWDLFFRNTPSRIAAQLDVGNAGAAGADPITEIRRYPGRVKSIHVKDYADGRPDLIVGDGETDWSKLIQVAVETGGTEWFIIEHETRPETALAEVKESLRRLQAFVSGRRTAQAMCAPCVSTYTA
jgi:sugar phosphate isomerase/epimerase